MGRKGLSIKQKLLATSLVVAVLTASVSYFGYKGITRVHGALGAIATNSKALRNHLEGDMMHDGLRADVLAALFDAKHSNGKDKDQIAQDLADHSEWFRRTLSENEKLPLSPEIKKAISEAKPALDAYIQSADEVFSLAYKDFDQAQVKLKDFETSFAELEEKNEKLSDFISKANEETEAAVAPLIRESILSLLFVAGLAILVGNSVMFFVSNQIRGGLHSISEATERVRLEVMERLRECMNSLAVGDLLFEPKVNIEPVRYPRQDEIGAVAASLNGMLDSLGESMVGLEVARNDLSKIMVSLGKNSEKVVQTGVFLEEAAKENRNSAEMLAQDSEEIVQVSDSAYNEVSNLQQSVTSVMRDLSLQADTVLETSATLAETAASLDSVVSSATSMSDAAVSGRSALKETTSAIRRVEDQAISAAEKIKELDQVGRQIGSIVDTISIIAGQTNLLALNAAIEAARAGENGRGFAVVADEVRKLAEQSKVATEQIAVLVQSVIVSVRESVAAIDRTNEEVRLGAEKMMLTDAAFEDILTSVETVSLQIGEVYSANSKMLNVMDHAVKVAEKSKENSDDLASQELANRALMLTSSMKVLLESCQRSTAMAEEVTSNADCVQSASSELRGLARDLDAVISKFKVKEESESMSEMPLAA